MGNFSPSETIGRLQEALSNLEYYRSNEPHGEYRLRLLNTILLAKETTFIPEVREALDLKYHTLISEINQAILDINKSSTGPSEYTYEIHRKASSIILELSDAISEIQFHADSSERNFFSKANLELSEELSEAKSNSEQIRTLKDEIEKERGYIENEKRSLLEEQEKFNDFKAKLTIADNELDFQAVAKSNLGQSKKWLMACIVFLLSTLFYGFKATVHSSEILSKTKSSLAESGLQTAEAVMTVFKYNLAIALITHVIIFSLLLCVLIFCVKNYNSRMHNYVVNIHRSAALKSTISLLNTAKSDAGNDQILVQSCQAIFCHQKSGFSGKDGDVQSPNFISNFIDKATK